MNEKIKDLLVKSGIPNEDLYEIFEGGSASTNLFYLENFSKLIVKNCVEICENSCIPFDVDVWRESTKKEISALTAKALAEKIKNHFGVE